MKAAKAGETLEHVLFVFIEAAGEFAGDRRRLLVPHYFPANRPIKS